VKEEMRSLPRESGQLSVNQYEGWYELPVTGNMQVYGMQFY